MFIPGMTGILSGAGQFASAPPPANDPWDDIVSLATTDGWLSSYDMNNPDTWTLRDAGGGSMFYSSVLDALGNRNALIQATTGSQPAQVTVGGHYMMQCNASRLLARSAGTITSPRAMILTLRAPSTSNFRNFIGDNSLNFLAQSGTYAFLISDGSTNNTSGNNVFSANTVAVVSAIWASGTNNCKVRVNGTQVYQSTLTPPTMTGLRLGYGFTGEIGYLGVYQGSVSGSSDALSRMEALLMDQHGI